MAKKKTATAIIVKKAEAQKLFVAVGMKNAAKWSAARCQSKIAELADIVDEDTDVGEHQELLDEILAALENDLDVTVEDGRSAPKKSAPKKTTSRRKKKEPEPEAEEEDSEEEEEEDDEEDEDAGDEEEETVPVKKKQTKKTPAKKKGPGVIASIIEFLEKANSKRGLSKQALCERLAKRFPDREAESMMRTINVQVPNRLKHDKDITVNSKDGKNGRVYWIDA